ncbi:sensor histidine kinase [Nocardia huaxiensis]|uniref:histidine kinase n=1 Tax=Nocardia huaxiensis TaxID=2755382 RepID=A0A7D6Z7C0_9NOCA|nr:histidine kinase [Nocardia huaxiensis]QLY33524.1 two-component sensor histidine kinase [Nocardia huaxiensis]UFS99558.1 histidine kinase [Nocardia huaxiensis]
MRRPWFEDWPAWQRDGLMAAACFAVGSLLLLVNAPLVVRFGAAADVPVTWWAPYVALAAICCTQVLRTRAPIAGLLAGIVVTAAAVPVAGLSLGALYVLSDLLYSATMNSSLRANRIIIGVTGSTVAAVGVSVALASGDWRLGLLTVLGVGAFPLIPVWWATEVRSHRAMADAARERADQLERIAELDRRAAVVAERARMARDLHDVIAGHLSAIAIQSEAALSMVDGDPEITRKVLLSVRENSVASLTEMRAMIGLLRSDDPNAPEPRTAPPRLTDLDPLLDSARAAGLAVRSHIDTPPDLPAAVDLSAYRIVQEALTNAVKHAPGSRTEVTLSRCEDTLLIDVTNRAAVGAPASNGAAAAHGPDGGVPDHESGKGGTGLSNMRERAQAVGGTFAAGPCDDGWRVRAELPISGGVG